MLAKLKNYSWLPIAFVGVGTLFFVSALWNFSHAYVLAGGENPLILLEGRIPAWSGTALAIGAASIGADIIKAVSGFILVSALLNKSLRWPVRVGAVILALIVCIPTLMWSARSATGMAAMAFGDAIAGRSNEAAAVVSLRAQIEADQQRLTWLAGQTASNTRARVAREAADLRKELAANRQQLRTAKGVGYADAGGGVIAGTLGVSERKITDWTVILLVVVIEIGSTLGFPMLALATRLGAAKREDDTTQEDRLSQSLVRVPPAPARQEDAAPRNQVAPEHTTHVDQSPAPLAAAGGDEQEGAPLGKIDCQGEELPPAPQPTVHEKAMVPLREALVARSGGGKILPFKGPDTRKHATMGDGHVEEFVRMLSAESRTGDSLPFRSTVWQAYNRFCMDKHLRPMNDKALSNALSRVGVSRHRPTGGSVYVRLPADLDAKVAASRKYFSTDAGVALSAH